MRLRILPPCSSFFFIEADNYMVAEFHPRLVGLTGSVDDVRKAAKEYRVYYMKTEEDGADYLVDHSIIMSVLLSILSFTSP